MIVLISTYWNVNINQYGKWYCHYNVLISTYWNVNFKKEKTNSKKSIRFNLNLLECKFLIKIIDV